MIRPGVVVERAVGVEDVDHRQLLPLADVVVVRIVGRRDLHAAGAQLGLGPFVGHERNLAVQQRQQQLAAGAGHVAQLDQAAAACVRRRSARSSSCACNVGLSLFARRSASFCAQLGFGLVERRGRIGMHGHGRVAEHRLGPRRGDRDVRRLARLADRSPDSGSARSGPSTVSWNTSSSLTAVCRNVSQFTSRLPR